MADEDGIEKEDRIGYGIDPEGGKVIDPTKNVLDLVKAESKYQDGMRSSLKEMHDYAFATTAIFQNFAREQESKFQNAMRDVESRRVDQLALQRQTYEQRIADMLSESVRSTSQLVSGQLVQIQATFDARVKSLEDYRLTSQGRSSVSDPALAITLQTLAASVADQATTTAASLAKITATISSLTSTGDQTAGSTKTKQDFTAWIFAAVATLAAVALVLVDALALHK
jgi:hypothetical protein